MRNHKRYQAPFARLFLCISDFSPVFLYRNLDEEKRRGIVGELGCTYNENNNWAGHAPALLLEY